VKLCLILFFFSALNLPLAVESGSTRTHLGMTASREEKRHVMGGCTTSLLSATKASQETVPKHPQLYYE
jgi:hypothetical protein